MDLDKLVNFNDTGWKDIWCIVEIYLQKVARKF